MPRQTAYTRVAETLREAILNGRYRNGQQLPTESALCREFAISRITVRQALRILEEEALVRRRQGIGTFVSSRRTRRIPILNADFYGSVARHAPDLKRRLLEMDWIDAPDSLAEQLEICAGDAVLRAARVDLLRNVPVSTDEACFVGRFADRLTKKDLGDLDLIECWQHRQNVEIQHASQIIDVAKARQPFARRLQVRGGQPLLRETNVLYVVGSRPAAVVASYYRVEYFRFEATVSIRPRGGRGHRP